MRQARVCEFLGLPCTHLRTFLDLPPAVRLSIYEAAGLPLDTSISLAHAPRRAREENDENGTNEHSDDIDRVPSSGLILNLLQSCRTLHKEVLAITLSRNTLIVDSGHLGYALPFLRRLAPEYCSYITNLHIELQRDLKKTNLQSPGVIKQLDVTQVTAWQAAARHLLAHAQPKSLRVGLVCDRNMVDHSISVTRPFIECPGKLARLDLRLSTLRDPSLSQRAMETVARATGNDFYPALRQGVFDIFGLPSEIRSQILEYTDLVTPTRHVLWDSRNRYRCEYLRHPYGSLASDPSPHELCCRLPWWQWDSKVPFSEFDFCPVRHSAYTSTCCCWEPPSYLMLVSRAFYHDAQAVFLARNRIIVLPELKYHRIDRPQRSYRSEPSKFLTMTTWPAVLSHMNHLELVFGEYDLLLCNDPCNQAWLDWKFAVSHLLNYANATNFTLAVYLPSVERQPSEDESVWPLYQQYHANANSVWERRIRAYKNILEPLRSLGSLKRLFIYVEVPGVRWCRCLEYFPDLASEGEEMQRWRRRACDLESRLEKFVMGSEYQSPASGKYEFPSWRWQVCYIVH